MVSIALVDARKTSLTGVQNSKKKSGRQNTSRLDRLQSLMGGAITSDVHPALNPTPASPLAVLPN